MRSLPTDPHLHSPTNLLKTIPLVPQWVKGGSFPLKTPKVYLDDLKKPELIYKLGFGCLEIEKVIAYDPDRIIYIDKRSCSPLKIPSNDISHLVKKNWHLETF